ncbi:MAG: sigma-70 family RNA polymerase sigma factor [Planctomycetes bacterium]|nr:sigma-70 family RNA polymerase sigma factor [Planctomycetota bacterium]
MTADPSRLDAIATQWSLVRAAHAAGTPESAAAARHALVLRYARAIRRYVGGIARDDGDADELAQEAVVRLLSGDFAGADPNRGRFRDLIRTAVRNMVRKHWAKGNRRKSADLDPDLLAGADDRADAAWDGAWQQNVLDHAWAALREYERANPGTRAETVLRLRTAHPDDTSEQLAERLAARAGAPVRADAARQMLRRARVRFAGFVVDEVRAGLADPTPDRVTDELAALGLLEFVRDFLPADWSATGKLTEE